jgi:hypothetical protein
MSRVVVEVVLPVVRHRFLKGRAHASTKHLRWAAEFDEKSRNVRLQQEKEVQRQEETEYNFQARGRKIRMLQNFLMAKHDVSVLARMLHK